MSIVEQSPPQAPVGTMPIAWFDYSPPLRRLPRRFKRIDARDGGGEITYAIDVDCRPVPFKFLCKTRVQHGASRPVVIMLAGMGLTPPTFHGVGPYLFETHDLVLIDYASHWVPERHPAEGVSLRIMARSIWRVAEALGLREVSLAGSSLGGGLCLLAALDVPAGIRIERMVLANPACYPQELPGMYKLMRFPLLGDALAHTTDVNKLLDGLAYIGYVNPEKVPRDVRACYARTLGTPEGRAVLKLMMRQLPGGPHEMASHLRRLGEITQPTLIAWGIQDKLLIPSNGERLARELGNATYVEFSDLSHMPHEESPERVGPVWARFLTGQ